MILTRAQIQTVLYANHQAATLGSYPEIAFLQFIVQHQQQQCQNFIPLFNNLHLHFIIENH